jgi:hypothetical protein
MQFYIKNDGIYFKREENSDERFMSGITDRIQEDAKQAIEAWHYEFGDEPLEYDSTDWLDAAFEVYPDQEEEEEIELFATTLLPKDLFIKLFEKEVEIV